MILVATINVRTECFVYKMLVSNLHKCYYINYFIFMFVLKKIVINPNSQPTLFVISLSCF